MNVSFLRVKLAFAFQAHQNEPYKKKLSGNFQNRNWAINFLRRKESPRAKLASTREPNRPQLDLKKEKENMRLKIEARNFCFRQPPASENRNRAFCRFFRIFVHNEVCSRSYTRLTAFDGATAHPEKGRKCGKKNNDQVTNFRRSWSVAGTFEVRLLGIKCIYIDVPVEIEKKKTV